MAEHDDAGLRLGCFSAAFALALLLHQLWWDGFETSGAHPVVVAAALAVLLRPSSVPRLLVLLGAEVVAVALDMPGAGSHTLLAAVCAATVVGWTAARAARTRRLPAPGELWDGVAPFLRWSVVVLYAAAALAKLNTGYFDAAVSCAAALAPRVAWWDPALLDAGWLRQGAIWGSVATEAALPVLLLVRRTRAAGLMLGVGFHLVLALAGNVPFTGLLLALYVAFLPPGAAGRALGRLRLRALGTRAQLLTAAAAGAAWVLGALAEDADPAGVQAAIGTGTRLAVLAWVLGLGALLVADLRERAPRGPSLGLRVRHPVLAAGLAVLVLNAASPYLGGKTESSFAMYSNLQTEGESWNHLFLPAAVRVLPHQDRLVRVTASNDPALLRRTRGGTRMVRFEVERYLRLHPGARATVTPGALAAEPPLLAPLLDRVAKFRDVRAEEQRGC